MSLILEALRKSEAERRRGEMPGLRAELPPPAATRRTGLRKALPWIVAVAAIGVAAVLLLRPWSRHAAIPVSPEAATSAPTSTPAESVRMQPQPPAVPPVETAPIAQRELPKPAPAAQTASPAPAVVVETAPQPSPPTAPAAEVPPPPAPSADGETTVNALPADLRKALPPLQLSMHMWDPDPARRFVILDGERYAEGDSVGPMQIRRIDAKGVLFDWQGRSIRLPLR